MVLTFHNFCVVAISSALFTYLYRSISPKITNTWFKRFGKLNKRDQIEWNERVVSSVHAIIASVVSTAVLVSDKKMQDDPVWGHSIIAQSILGFTLSYMIVGRSHI